jgi:hypothetical protein
MPGINSSIFKKTAASSVLGLGALALLISSGGTAAAQPGCEAGARRLRDQPRSR